MTAISLNCWSESDQKAIRAQLVRILNSGPFHQSQRRQRFLEYLVNEAEVGKMMKVNPAITLQAWRLGYSFRDPAILDRYALDLVQSGLAET